MAADFKLFGFVHRKDRRVKERSLYQGLVTKLEKIRCTYFDPKTFRGCWTFITFITLHYIAWTIFLVAWGVTFIAWTIFLVTWGVIIHCVDYFPCYLGCKKHHPL